MGSQEISARWFLVNVLRRTLVREKTAGYELRHGQLPLLETILSFPDSTQQELTERLKVTAPSTAQSLARLEKAGLVEKRTDSEDRRRNRIRGTKAGEAAAKAYRKSFDETDQQMLAGMSEEELRTLSGYLERMIKNLNGSAEEIPVCPFWKGDAPK